VELLNADVLVEVFELVTVTPTTTIAGIIVHDMLLPSTNGSFSTRKRRLGHGFLNTTSNVRLAKSLSPPYPT
jgi:hypothetical protein